MGKNYWRAIDADPQFEVRLGRTGLAPSWYGMKICGKGFHQPVLYPDYGEGGFNSDERYFLKSHGACFKSTVRIQKPALRLRFDPTDTPGDVALSKIIIKRRSTLAVLFARAFNIYLRDRKVGKSPSQILREKWDTFRLIGWSGLVTNPHRSQSKSSPPVRVDVELNYKQWIEQVEKEYFTRLGKQDAKRSLETHLFLALFTPDSQQSLPALLASF